MRKLVTVLLLVTGFFASAQMLDESILKGNKICYHRNYLNFCSLGLSSPNSAIKKNFGSGLFFGVGYACYIKKTSKLGLGLYSQIAFNRFSGGGSSSFFLGGVAGYALNRKTIFETKLLIGAGKFKPGEKMLKQMGYSEVTESTMGVRGIFGFNIRQRISQKLYLLSGLDINFGKAAFVATNSGISSGDGYGSSTREHVSGHLNYTSIYLGFALILH